MFTVQHASAADKSVLRIDQRIANITQNLNEQGYFSSSLNSQKDETLIVGDNYYIESCQNYPYHDQKSPQAGFHRLANDLELGLKKGLQCLAGMSDVGSLHSYHQQQLVKLLDLLESPQKKTIRCVADEMYAMAVSKSPHDQAQPDENKFTRTMPYPSIVIDTYRISGFISGKHKPEVYRDFFKLDERQVDQHLKGNPQRFKGMHQYKDRSGLLFHEVVHWLGHEHTNTSPDIVFLYETCCFGGSDFISDEATNEQFQNQACQILKDEELWVANRYKQSRLWKHKEYSQLKKSMRDQYE